MALLHTQCFSEALGFCVSFDVILPQPASAANTGAQRGKLPTLYLLHGYSDDHTIWQRRTAIERYVEGLPLAVVMPAVEHSFYTDMAYGPNYWTFVSEELPHLCESLFHLSVRREDRFAAGLSMGGYGALKLGLLRPDRYAAVASLSGAVDVLRLNELSGNVLTKQNALKRIFGDMDALRGSDNDLDAVAARVCAAQAQLPAIYLCCGTEDHLLEINRRFVAEHGARLSIAYEEFPGSHTWAFWDTHIQHVLSWLPIRR